MPKLLYPKNIAELQNYLENSDCPSKIKNEILKYIFGLKNAEVVKPPTSLST